MWRRRELNSAALCWLGAVVVVVAAARASVARRLMLSLERRADPRFVVLPERVAVPEGATRGLECRRIPFECPGARVVGAGVPPW